MEANTRTKATRPGILLVLATLAMLLVSMVGAGAAGAQGEAAPNKPEQANCATGRTLPVSKISLQLWTFNRFIGSGAGAPAGMTPGATTAERLEQVLAFLAEAGYRNIEPFSFHGLTAEQFDALAQEYGLKVLSRHMSTNEANWPTNLADAKLLGQRYTGSGGFASPGISSYQNVLATAETLNRLGELSVKNGTGKIFGHNHASEFFTKYMDDGVLKSAWQILVENTDPRYVTFQLDVGWATIAGEDAVALVEEFGDRIELLHVKDAIVTTPQTGSGPGQGGVWMQTTIGQGDVDWASLFAAAQGDVKLYVIEMDPPSNTWDPFAFAADSFQYVDCLTF